MSQAPCAEDDPRMNGFPCNGSHKPKRRENQHGMWSTCQACGLRLMYQPKKGSDGQSRHMGPHPNLTRAAMEEISKTTPANQVTERLVNGKLMELKGLQLQRGLTETMAINLSYHSYLKRMGLLNDAEGSPKAKAKAMATPSKSTPSLTPEEALLQATQEYLDAKGIDHLDAHEFAETVKQTTIQKLDESVTPTKPRALFLVKTEQKEPPMSKAAAASASQNIPIAVDSSDDDAVLVEEGTESKGL